MTTDLHRGFTLDDDAFRCLSCGVRYEQGVIHADGDRLLDAERAARHHVESAHGGPLAALLARGRDGSGLSQVQQQVVGLLARGLDDRQIASELGGRSESTVRNHRFQVRRRYREARVLVALFELLDAGATDPFIDFHPGLPVDDDRAVVTTSEADKVLARVFPGRERLARFPKKEKHKLIVLRVLVERFETGRRYTEKEVNAVLGAVFDDYAVLRRYLVDYRFLDRERDGSAYWRVDGQGRP